MSIARGIIPMSSSLYVKVSADGLDGHRCDTDLATLHRPRLSGSSLTIGEYANLPRLGSARGSLFYGGTHVVSVQYTLCQHGDFLKYPFLPDMRLKHLAIGLALLTLVVWCHS